MRLFGFEVTRAKLSNIIVSQDTLAKLAVDSGGSIRIPQVFRRKKHKIRWLIPKCEAKKIGRKIGKTTPYSGRLRLSFCYPLKSIMS